MKILIADDEITMRRVLRTGLALARFHEELTRARRTRHTVGAIMLDIDCFKRINDALGHAAGDEVLQQVGKRLTEAIRPYDSVGRYDGEEFLMVIPNCTLAETPKVAERVRDAIAAAPIPTARGAIPVSASFGVSAATEGGAMDADALIAAAARALYRARELGSNRVEWFSSDSGGAAWPRHET